MNRLPFTNSVASISINISDWSGAFCKLQKHWRDKIIQQVNSKSITSKVQPTSPLTHDSLLQASLIRHVKQQPGIHHLPKSLSMASSGYPGSTSYYGNRNSSDASFKNHEQSRAAQAAQASTASHTEPIPDDNLTLISLGKGPSCMCKRRRPYCWM